MEITAQSRYIRVTPRKVKVVIDLIKGKKAGEALDVLSFTHKAASRTLLKLLRSAIANATRRGDIDIDTLFIKRISVGPGPALKRFRPAPQGRAVPVKKRTSHISLVLEEG